MAQSNNRMHATRDTLPVMLRGTLGAARDARRYVAKTKTNAMNDIKTLITSPAFWFASVLLAFLMSFFASYAKDWTDKWYVRRSKKKDEEAKRRQKDFEERVIKLKENPHLLSVYQSDLMYQKLRHILYLIVSYVGLALSFYSILRRELGVALGMLIFSFIVFVIQLRSVSRGLYELRSIINAALEDDGDHFIG